MTEGTSHLVQLLLPLRDPDGEPFGPAPFAELRAELTERFGGLTAYSRAPAEGLWTDGSAGGERPQRDDVVVYEVMADELDTEWWKALRARLERRFRQEELVVRALPLTRL